MNTQRASLTVTNRTIAGKKVATLRKAGLIPGHVFGKQLQSVDVSVDAKVFAKLYKEVGETGLIMLQVEGEKETRPVLIDNLDLHPVSDAILHIDFHQVNLKEKVQATIPVEVIGESEAVKAGGVLVMVYNELEVEALPTDLPEKFEIDIAALKAVGDDIKVSSLQFDRTKVELLDIDADEVLATIQAPKEEVVVEEASPVEVEITKGGPTTEEGKAAASGAPAPEAAKEKKE